MKKFDVYVVHHSHTDIGYTDLQEVVILNQVDYIKSVIKYLNDAYANNTCVKDFKWNCETYYCVERFFEDCTQAEKEDFIKYVKLGNIGLSATYLNFNDLIDKNVLSKRTNEAVELFKEYGVNFNIAMNADINGISLGSLDAFLDNGIEFLYTNIHCHHGMYPLYQNQQPYFWENKAGKKMLVWNGEHYNLGNVMGLVENKTPNFMMQNYQGNGKKQSHVDDVRDNIKNYIDLCLEHGYKYDFIPMSVSGVFSDNAPPNLEIIELITEFNKKYGDEIHIEMVTVAELYEKIKDKVADCNTYKGDLTDWWAHGVPSTPYSVKHYKEAQRMYNLCERLDPEHKIISEKLEREAEDNIMLYSEHTWGHSSTITNPYDTMVLNLDVRKTSYASKAHEASAKNLHKLKHAMGDKLRYYDRDGKIKAVNSTNQKVTDVVEFYIEVWAYGDIIIENAETHEVMKTQISSHPRGVLVSFIDNFEPNEEKIYTYKEIEKKNETINSRVAYSGSERVRDIVNDYDKLTYTLPYGIENDFFKIGYEIGKGITTFYNKKLDCEMLMANDDAKFFTPIYENTEIRTDTYEERRRLGRNIRGLHAKKYIGQLDDIKIIDAGDVFKTVELIYKLQGTYFSSIVIKMFNDIPRIDFKYKLAKTYSEDIENIMLPLALNIDKETYIDKSAVSFKCGVEQIPGTCMEYYLVDTGVVYKNNKVNIEIQTLDAPMIYAGELKHHPILLCDNKEENNKRNIYSWIMNNIWETNFKMDLSGATEYCYSLTMSNFENVDDSFEHMRNSYNRIITFMIK